MIELPTQEAADYLKEVEAYANKHGLREALDDKLCYLDQFGTNSWADRNVSKVVLYPDRDPNSFNFGVYWRKRDDDGNIIEGFQEAPAIVGGLIFHPGWMGKDTGNHIEVDPSNEPHWSVHT